MPFISVFMDGDSNPRRFKAIKNHFYEITDIHVAITSAGNNDVQVYDRALEDITGGIVANNNKPLLVYPTDITNAFDATFGEPIRTKYITLARRNSNAMFSFITINYRFVRASMAELVWEWVGKNR